MTATTDGRRGVTQAGALRAAFFCLALAACAPAPQTPPPVPAPAPVQRPPRDTFRIVEPMDTVPVLVDTVRVPPDTTPDVPPPPPIVRVCAGGDVTLGTNLDTAWARLGAGRLRANYGASDDPMSLVAPLRPMFADADLVVLNVETAIGEGPARTKCGPRSRNCYAFRAPPASAEALRSLARHDAIVVGNLANNHARDAGDEGVRSTIANLTRAGVLVTGVDTLATAVRLRDSMVVGVLGFYSGEMLTDSRNTAAVMRHVARAVEEYGTVIVTAHIGAEGIGAQRTRDTVEMFLSTIDRGNSVAFARAALNAGASVVIGHGPHVLRGGEWRGDDKLVLYSLGNLLTYGPFNNAEPINRGVVACVDISGGSVIGGDLRPTVQRAPGIVDSDWSRRGLKLIDSLSVLDFPATGIRIDAWGEILRRRN